MAERFDYFAIFAGMRTGSNFLERNINAMPDLKCWGELFNPYFIAHEKQERFLGVTLRQRDKDPLSLIARIREETAGLAGFRLFHDHDARVREHALADPRCAKIVLTRNPLDSYVSWKLALATDQWVLTDAKGRRDGKATFDAPEFRRYFEDQVGFTDAIRRRLQASGQTAFELRYEDLQSVEVMAGLMRFLGSRGEVTRLETSLKKQNPAPLAEKVTNFDTMRQALLDMDPMGLDAQPGFEPARGAAVPSWIASEVAPILFQPVRGAGDQALRRWLEGLGPIRTGLSQKELRAWMREAGPVQAVTILRHPLARAWTAFVEKVLPTDVAALPRFAPRSRRATRCPCPRPGPMWTGAPRRRNRPSWRS